MHAEPQQLLPFERDLSKGRNNQHSKRSFERANKEGMRQRVMEMLRARGSLTCREFKDAVGKEMNEVSGRFSELQKMGKIYQSTQRRGNCGVWYEMDGSL